MNLPDALKVSSNIRSALLSACVRCEVAGSIRRGVDYPGDIDIVLTLRDGRPPLVFGQKTPVFTTYLDALLWRMENDSVLTRTSGGDKLKKYTLSIANWGVSAAIPIIVKMQITVATPETWAYWYTIRTGPADFSHWIVTPKAVGGALPDGMYFKDCRLQSESKIYNTPEEIDIFMALGLPWIEPKDRRVQWRKR